MSREERRGKEARQGDCFELQQRLYGHSAAVTCVHVSTAHSLVVSGDSSSDLLLWHLSYTRSSRGEQAAADGSAAASARGVCRQRCTARLMRRLRAGLVNVDHGAADGASGVCAVVISNVSGSITCASGRTLSTWRCPRPPL